MQTACVYIGQSQLFVVTSSEVGVCSVCSVPPATESVFHVVKLFVCGTWRSFVDELEMPLPRMPCSKMAETPALFFFSSDSRDREEKYT